MTTNEKHRASLERLPRAARMSFATREGIMHDEDLPEVFPDQTGSPERAPSLPFGAIVSGSRKGAVQFSVLCDRASEVAVSLVDGTGRERERHALAPMGEGVFAAAVDGVVPGALYYFLLDGTRVPDPFARFLPASVHGPAEVVDPAYPWAHGWGPGRPLGEQIIYELHVGTFTPEGTYEAARQKLPLLKELGITTIELLPLASFAGQRGWGYDGVALFAPHAAYGRPEELRRFVDEAHALGLGVILDVVYNHMGPSGNYLASYSGRYFKKDGDNPWGQGFNFEDWPMRALVLENVRYWLADFRFDGLRLDATHTIHDQSPRHILEEAAAVAHAAHPNAIVIAEDERNEAALVERFGLDALWADDFHHAVHVTATREAHGYYKSFAPGVATIAETVRGGWLFQGQTSPSTDKPRGTNTARLPAHAFIYALQNHDQIGNRALGERLVHLVGPEMSAGLAALLLFLPMTPLLFMGEEWGASSPFLYFTDHDPELGRLVSEGRRKEFRDFPAFATQEGAALIPDPQVESTFLRSKLRWDERWREPHASLLSLYQRLIHLRKTDPVLARADRASMETTGEGGLLTVRRSHGHEDRLLILNLGIAPASPEDLSPWLSDRVVVLRTDEGRATDPLWRGSALIARGGG
jgi:maltooligosyltrehalose trehalohydrolase